MPLACASGAALALRWGPLVILTPSRKAFVRWCVRVGFDCPGGEAMAERLLKGLARVGLTLDFAPRDEHLRKRTTDGDALLMGFMILHGLGPVLGERE